MNMVETSINQRLEELRREINYHNHRYYVLDDPVVSDAVPCPSLRRPAGQ